MLTARVIVIRISLASMLTSVFIAIIAFSAFYFTPYKWFYWREIKIHSLRWICAMYFTISLGRGASFVICARNQRCISMVPVGRTGKFPAVGIAQIWRAVVFGGIFRASLATRKIERHPGNYYSVGHYFWIVATDDCVLQKTWEREFR